MFGGTATARKLTLLKCTCMKRLDPCILGHAGWQKRYLWCALQCSLEKLGGRPNVCWVIWRPMAKNGGWLLRGAARGIGGALHLCVVQRRGGSALAGPSGVAAAAHEPGKVQKLIAVHAVQLERLVAAAAGRERAARQEGEGRGGRLRDGHGR